MSGTDYNYDDNGQFFPFFILTLTCLVTLPLTYNVLKKNEDIENTAPRIQSDFKPKHDDLIQAQRRAQKRKEFKTKRTIAVVLGYLIMAWMVYKIIVTKRIMPKIWDPYDILGLSRSTSEQAIKKHKRLSSLKYHPDKVRPDASKNETVETLNDRWVEMSKAYSALLDEEVRNNWIQYGHPDGKQSFSIGIALPKLMISEGNGKYVLLFYALILGVALPYVVGKWWYGTQALTKDGVIIASAGKIFKEYKEEITIGGVVAATSTGEEFQQLLKGPKSDAGLSKVEKSIAAPEAGLSDQDLSRLKEIEDPLRRKVLALLWAYLARVDLGDDTLENSQYASAMQVARQMPNFVVAKAFFKVIGDKVITPSALVQLVVKGRIIPPGTKHVPEVNEAELEDIDPEEGDLDALLGRKSAKSRRKKPIANEPTADFNNKENSIQPPLAHAPYFARNHSPRWRVFLTDAGAGRIGVPPFTFTEFDKPIFEAADNTPTFNMQTFKCQFQAPPQVGQFAFKMHLICDSYVGLDSTVDVVLDVQDMSKVAVVESEDEISEPDEDTLAGQMQAMKGGGGATGKRKKKAVKADEEEEDDEDEDESDTDGEVEEVSDTDTETDEE
ncbi:hypothetical protein GJ744_012400 [Endocarpon pusillum]|uniref:J domain-containing protein n=1 Tax=Endocarpon pusillum TaxID=364733 RepID=A0A8H7ABU3_9EURO|nr:hypothetical protein GJ744_012400 [Endocarpon pusillum]